MRECCEVCGEHRPHSMEEHHVLPRRFGGGDHAENIVTLCASCHAALESIYDKRFWTAVGLRPSDDGGTVGEYINRRLTIDDQHPPVPKADLYAKYRQWCAAADVDAVSQHKFTQRLQRLDGVASGKRYVDGEQRRCYTGVAESPLTESQ